ncbi:Late embryogenesis abundant protein [Melia azedarach]|uniref:Late embryogenesis abundant protein n=1 Tax=Melia azedarach TaxID=155640 RepID=A0ACC1XLG9_MELAZ|nr:Late embryogenesis abundant protein [Melia azedarach]
MATREQAKPLAPSAHQFYKDELDEVISKQFKLRRRRYIQCCGCFTALLLIAMVIIIVLATVIHVKDPSIRMNSVTIQHMEFFDNRTIRFDRNITLLADVSVKNPNMATLRYSSTTTTIYYEDTLVGESRIPPGFAKARRTLRMNMTVDIIPEKLLSVPSLSTDLFAYKALNMSSYTRIAGRVKVLKIFKKSVSVKMNCTITYNFSSQAIQDNCRRRD